MAMRPFTLSLCMLFLASACFAISSNRFNQCQLDSLNALEPDHRVESEGGVIETFNSQHPELQCAGVSVSRRTIYPNGLHLPSYSPYPQLMIIIQGKGALGLALPGCPETFEEPAEESSSRKGRQQEVQDRHQKIRRFNEGDVLLIPPGVPYWTFNNGDEPLVAVSLLDTSSFHNQLDQSPREFYLAGSPDIEHPETIRVQKQKRAGGRKQKEDEKEEEGGSVLSGFSKQFLAQSFNIDEDIAEKLQSPDDEMKQIVKVKEGLSIISPKWQEQQQQEEEEEEEEEDEDEDEHRSHPPRRPSHGKHEKEEEDEPRSSHGKHAQEKEEEVKEKEEEKPSGSEHKSRERRWKKKTRPEGEEEEVEEEWETKHSKRKGPVNGIEESICTLKLRESISRPSRADLYNPKAGRISTLNSLTFPALKPFGLSAQYVVLYKNGIYAPHWNENANSVLYVIRGQGTVRVVNCTGDAVFDGELKRGQLLVVPQNFVVAEEASEKGFEYVVFKTNELASTSYLKDVFRAIPAEVLANTYNLRHSQVLQLKFQGNSGPLVNPDSQ
ncbi:hypothetical protein Fmac_027812 [Flemingia macrophylla]|uniref:Cupin type-1 domain-containing protein n=1 Tax=Flemingia macrophylla TaxID=520843 RepID=A0ABD1LIX3_9FABA